MPTNDEILDAIATDVSDGVASFTSDAQTVTGMDPEKRLKVADKLAARDILDGENPQGGARSGWNTLRMARVVPPGAV